MTGFTPALVVVVNNRPDWRRVVDERWYRIPIQHAPCPVAAEILAFYLTGRLGDEAWQVRYYAEVRQYQLLRRRELLPAETSHPRAGDWYYRIVLGPLQRLTHPLLSRKLRRITFIPTTLEQLQSAVDVADLWLPDDAETVLWSYFPDAALKATRRLSIEEQHGTYEVCPHAVTHGLVGRGRRSKSVPGRRPYKEHPLLEPKSECFSAPLALQPRRLPLPPRSRQI